ncbi:MAG: glycosyltransferase [Terrimicrobiaceae bacterium]
MKVLHIISGLDQGGAEGCLCRLIRADRESSHSVISLLDEGIYGAALRAEGIPVHTIGMSRGRPSLRGCLKLIRTVRSVHPDIVQTWMCHADLLGGLAARITGSGTVVWGIRNTLLDNKTTSLSTRLVVRACALLSPYIPSAIVSCSATAAEQHIQIGYDAVKMRTIPNGMDLARFQRDPIKRAEARAEIGLTGEECLFGMVARYDPQKDHKNLLLALRELAARTDFRWKCALIGRGLDSSNAVLRDLLKDSGLDSRVLLLGARDDVSHIMNGLDCHVLSSAYGEGFPNVVAEAMACGVPCVATDVGDARRIIGNTGWVVPPRDQSALAGALGEVLEELGSEKWESRRQLAERTIQQNFGLDRMCEAFQDVWSSCLAGRVKTA